MTYKAVLFDLDGTLVHTKPEYRYDVVGRTCKMLSSTATNESIDKFWFGTERDKIIIQEFRLHPDIFWPKFQELDGSESRKHFMEIYPDVV